jgi:redox-sensitive bicupin YhaK (pirin superfamily)
MSAGTLSGSVPSVRRRLSRVTATPPPAPGFIGAGHTAVEVLDTRDFPTNDPFVLLMDDRLDLPERRQIGGPHPHAGLETVTLLLEGAVHDRDEGELSTGDVAWMTAGRGVIHNEHVEAAGKVRILQLWIGLPERVREAAPGLQVLRAGSVPVRREPGVVARVYSGRSGDAEAPTRNLVPVTLVEIVLEPGRRIEQELPASYQGFFYVVEGSVTAGEEARPAQQGDVASFDRAGVLGSSLLSISAGPAGARVVLYAGEPQGESLVQRGPFVAESAEGLARFFWRYQQGEFTPLSRLTKAGSTGMN